MVTANRLPLEVFFEREKRHPQRRYLVQPIGGGRVEELSWGEVGDQARRAAAWLRSLDLPAGSRIAIISKNCAHWIVTDLAIWMAPEGIPTVAMPLHPEGRFDRQWSDLQACAPLEGDTPTAAEQLATLIYTSGTTGVPKGVMHNFSSFAFAASRGVELFGTREDDRMLSYLPLCHVAERMFVEMGSLYGGTTVFFAESLDTFVEDMKRARPTLLFGVPRIWTKFQMGVYSKMPAQKLDRLLKLPILGRIVGRKVLAGLGLDAVRYALCGAAPVPEALLLWYRRLGLDVLEVYGMTENSGYSHVCRPGRQKTGWIGQNSPGVEVRISDEGEVQVRSGATMVGYYKEPEKTAEVLTADGFLRTGDKGEQDADGNLRLTGRMKEIFKTSKGKYVAPAPIENRLAVHDRIEQVCVVGEGLSAPLGLCVLSEVGRREALNGTRGALESSLRAHLEQVNGALDKHERLVGLVLVQETWAVDNGFLTPTLKIKRNMVEGAYGSRFHEWVERREAVLWHE
ncbi:AMP-binding protein [Pseudomonas aeruginosa]|uniref:AMP-binding protein n=1 Tax=Pseudomonas aeruginosa TaxID=287 RepID=UPI001049B620|nr:AMP-binding protein [Pseudomonas aeruginosa]